MEQQQITNAVQARYAKAARSVRDGGSVSECCGESCGCGPDPITGRLYDAEQTGDLPAKAVADLFPAYDDDGGLLLVLTPSK